MAWSVADIIHFYHLIDNHGAAHWFQTIFGDKNTDKEMGSTGSDSTQTGHANNCYTRLLSGMTIAASDGYTNKLTKVCGAYSASVLRHVYNLLLAEDLQIPNLVKVTLSAIRKESKLGKTRRVLSKSTSAQLARIREMSSHLQDLLVEILQDPLLLLSDPEVFICRRSSPNRPVSIPKQNQLEIFKSSLQDLIKLHLPPLTDPPPIPQSRPRTWFLLSSAPHEHIHFMNEQLHTSSSSTVPSSVQNPSPSVKESEQTQMDHVIDDEESSVSSSESGLELDFSDSDDSNNRKVVANSGGDTAAPEASCLSSIADELRETYAIDAVPDVMSNRKRQLEKKLGAPKGKKARPSFSRQAQKWNTPCQFWIEMRCSKAEQCPFSHDVPQERRATICRYFMMGSCCKGEDCSHSHDVPCKYFHLHNSCQEANCRFSHGPLNSDQLTEFKAKLEQGFYNKPVPTVPENEPSALLQTPFSL